ncbi:MAG: SDR family oxidoreductase, partial [Christensenella sp.]
KRPGTPDELQGVVLYLASDASTFTTGTAISVDGAYTAW